MSARGHRSSGLDALATNRNSALPFLPTLVTALAVGSLTLLCRHPVENVAPPAAPVVIVSAAEPNIDIFFHRAPPKDPMVNPATIPAALAFGQAYPLAPAPLVAAKASNARIAGAVRRGCVAGHCEAKRADPVRSAANPPRAQDPVATSAIPLPFREEAEREDGLLPAGVLPFVPTAAVVADTVRSLASGAASLGGSVIGIVTAEN